MMRRESVCRLSVPAEVWTNDEHPIGSDQRYSVHIADSHGGDCGIGATAAAARASAARLVADRLSLATGACLHGGRRSMIGTATGDVALVEWCAISRGWAVFYGGPGREWISSAPAETREQALVIARQWAEVNGGAAWSIGFGA